MKKTAIISFALLGLLFLLPFANFSVAAPEDVVGVKVGDSFKWTLSMDLNTLVDFAEDLNETLDIEDLEDIGEFPGLYFKAKVLTLTEKSTTVNFTLVDYVEVNVTLTIGMPGYGEEVSPYPIPIWVLSNETENYLHYTYYAFMEMMSGYEEYFTFLFVAYNLNWTKAVEDINELYGLNPIYQDIEVAQKNTGFTMTIPEGLLNESQKVMEFLMTYNSNGVLTLAKLSYDGSMMMQIKLGGDEEAIPGYELPIIIGITTLTCTALAYAINKKNKIVK